ncbi:MAG: hypothetical protein GC181_10290 [Bacteroidetes bacterium]|nr:hypothetical protein [Bacteroidota bacterium]
MTQKKISIPKPCEYGWDNMALTSDRKGRHCAACDKVVVDFTKLSVEEIISFLEQHEGSRVCGYVNTIHTNNPNKIQRTSLLFHDFIDRKFRAGFIKNVGLVVAGFFLSLTGCIMTTAGEMSECVPAVTDSTQSDSFLFHPDDNLDFNSEMKEGELNP